MNESGGQVIKQSAEYISEKVRSDVKTAIILGSGLGRFAEQITDPVILPYDSIPGFKKSKVKGHANQMFCGRLEDKSLIIMKGRYHYYEGFSMFDVTYPVRVLAELGIENLIITNSAGSVKKELAPGSIMLIRDHINLSGRNPLLGLGDEFGPKFVDMSEAYSRDLIEIASSSADDLSIDLKRGIYVYLTGPTYETSAEIKMLAMLGGDVVGMSTVPEVIVGNQLGLNILGISSVTNYGTGIISGKVKHAEVLETNKKTAGTFIKLLKEIVKRI